MDDVVKAAELEPSKTPGAAVERGRGGARMWPEALKREAVDASLAPGARVGDIARRYGVHPQQLTRWRRASREGRLAAGAEKGANYVRVEMVESAPEQAASLVSAPIDNAVEIVVGRIVVRLPGLSSPARIAGIVTALETGA
jgi:transposase